jgi:aspartate racemase
MKTVGVVGGMGPAATVDFFRRIVEATPATRDQDHLHVLIDSNPAVPDRTAFLLAAGDDPRPVLVSMAQRLEAAGADLLVIPCNTASAFTTHVAASVRIPVLDWAAETALALRRRSRQANAVGLLATAGTVASGVYQDAFERVGMEVTLPRRATQQKVMTAIYADVKAGRRELAPVRKEVAEVASELVERGADALLLACTELSFLFADGDAIWPVPTLDASQLVAERVVQLAGYRLRGVESRYAA